MVKFCAVEKCDYAFEKDGSFIKFIFTTYTENESTDALEILVEEEYADELANWLFVSWEYLMTMDELTAQQIAIVRDGISKIEDETKRGELYLELQKKVPYHNQRDNESIATKEDVENNNTWLKDGDTAGDIMCNLTSEAMCLEMLGVEFPCKDCDSDCDKYEQFEDYLECLRLSNEYEHRGTNEARTKLAKLFGIKCELVDINSNDRNTIESKTTDSGSRLGDALKEGKSVLVSVSFGHIVRLQAITDEGLIIDDPYGKVYDFSKKGCTLKYYKKNEYDQRNGDGLGDENLWKWKDLQTNKITISYAEIYSTDN